MGEEGNRTPAVIGALLGQLGPNGHVGSIDRKRSGGERIWMVEGHSIGETLLGLDEGRLTFSGPLHRAVLGLAGGEGV